MEKPAPSSSRSRQLKKKSSSLSGVELKPLLAADSDELNDGDYRYYGSSRSGDNAEQSRSSAAVLSSDNTGTAVSAPVVCNSNVGDGGGVQEEEECDAATSTMDAQHQRNAVLFQLWRPENLAIPACYLCVGLMQGLSRPLLNVYPLDLGATEAQQTTIFSVAMLPCTLKIVFGVMSDQFPIPNIVYWFGGAKTRRTRPMSMMRRKGYMAIGWSLSTIAMILLLSNCNLSMDWNADNHGDKDEDHNDSSSSSAVVRNNAPTVQQLCLAFLLFGTGFWMADVMGDSIVAERAKLEQRKGQLQSTCYACRFFGMMVAAPISTVLYRQGNHGPRNIVLLMAIIPPIVMGPLIYLLQELPPTRVLSASEQCHEIWTAVCSRAVWQPMGFVYLYNVLQVPNAAWRQFLKTNLDFTASQLNALLIVAYALLYIGTLAYKYYFIRFSWRLVFKAGILFHGLISSLQTLLILGITFGLSPFLFALGDDVFADFIGGIQFLPTTIMMVNLCPDGSEGASYAMYTTVSNSALLLQPAISTLLLGIWDVSKPTLEAGDLSGLLKLTILTTLIQTSAVLFVGLLPNDHHDLEVLKTKQGSKSRLGGIVFLGIIFASTLDSVVVGVLNIINPDWRMGR